jgi:tRNA G10  N-methylase Trm11
MKYFFLLGSNPTLSLAELSAVFALGENLGYKAELVGKQNVLVLDLEESIATSALIKKLGGTIKIGIIDSEVKPTPATILPTLKNLVKGITPVGKFKFGISYYGENKLNTKVLGMELKKFLKESDISSRWVTSKETELSSVVVGQNKLTTSGKEFVLLQANDKLLIGYTLAVQPFKELSFRDYGRPARDDLSGMLPPKLAQIMINLTGINVETRHGASLLDPFCGSGTILTEAILMGFKNLIGSDISKKAIEDTKKNVEWVAKNYKLQTLPTCLPDRQAGRQVTNYKLFNKSASQISQVLKSNSIDAIITEPYLGPQRGRIDFNKVKHELEKLYSESFAEFKKILKPSGKIVMIWPVFSETAKLSFLSPNLSGFKICSPIPSEFLKYKSIKLTERNTIIYNRPGQKVWREVVILQ